VESQDLVRHSHCTVQGVLYSVGSLTTCTKLFNFPKRELGRNKEKRSFRAEWCEKYPWLHYDVGRDVALCYLCMQAGYEGKFLASSKRESAFTSSGFSYWKKATVAFSKHQPSKYHAEANEAVIQLPRQITGDVGELLSVRRGSTKVRNREFPNVRTWLVNRWDKRK